MRPAISPRLHLPMSSYHRPCLTTVRRHCLHYTTQLHHPVSSYNRPCRTPVRRHCLHYPTQLYHPMSSYHRPCPTPIRRHFPRYTTSSPPGLDELLSGLSPSGQPAEVPDISVDVPCGNYQKRKNLQERETDVRKCGMH